MIKTIEIGNNEYILYGLLAVTGSFYFTILEEYYTGGLYLWYINGVTDGSLVIVGFFTYIGIYGNSFFTNTYSFYIG
jgi:hypothetical protein